MYKFLIPGYYLFYSRLKRKSEIFSLIVVYPLLLILLLLINISFSIWVFLLLFFIALLSWISFYEIGYLENDAVTIKKENNPTLRISNDEIHFVRNNFVSIQLFRVVLGTLGLISLHYLSKHVSVHISLVHFIFFIALARLSFSLHNSLRSRWNILTYFLLSVSKYFSIVALFLYGKELYVTLVTLLFLFPIPRTLEHAVKVKYGLSSLKKIIGDLDAFRVKYYSVGLAVCLVFYFLLDKNVFFVPMLGFSWFFVFRTTAYLLVQKGLYNRTRFKAHTWKE